MQPMISMKTLSISRQKELLVSMEKLRLTCGKSDRRSPYVWHPLSISRGSLNVSKDAEKLDVPIANVKATSSNGQSHPQIVSLCFVPESRKITAIMRGGDVIVISVEEEGAPVSAFWILLLYYIQPTFSSKLKAHSNPEFLRLLGILTNRL